MNYPPFFLVAIKLLKHNHKVKINFFRQALMYLSQYPSSAALPMAQACTMNCNSWLRQD
jgi:hypothetical protein